MAENNVLTRNTSRPSVALDVIVTRILLLAEALSEKKLFQYQKEFMYRVIEAILLHDGDTLTGLWSRQSGKSEAIADCLCSVAIILPVLARSEVFKDDWRFNCTDDQGNYRGYKNGVKIGIYAPIQEQADIVFTRIKDTMNTDTTKQVCQELGVRREITNGNRVYLSNGSKIRSQSASEQSKIEGESYHVLVMDEAQDIGALKISKSLRPMVAAYNGVIVEIGTCSTQKSEFYSEIKKNERAYAQGGAKNHFFFNYLVCQKYNSMYKDFIDKEKQKIGEDSDAFKLSYECCWLLERGQFITQEKLQRPEIAILTGPYSEIWTKQKNRFTTQVVGIDFGKVHDPTVITVIDVDWRNPLAEEWVDTPETSVHYVAYQKHIVAWHMLLGDNYEHQFTQIVEFLQDFKGLRKIVVDATGVGQWGLDKFTVHYSEFNRGKTKDGQPDIGYVEVVGVNFNTQSKSEGFKLLHGDFETGRITFPAGEKTRKTRLFRRFVGEMLDLKKIYKNGYMNCEAPDEPGAHDDFPVSAMLANFGAQTPADANEIEVSSNEFLR